MDGFLAGKSYQQETGSLFRYAWSPAISRVASGGRYSATATPGSSAKFTFWGKGITLQALAVPGTGGAFLYIDGKVRARIDSSASRPRSLRVTANNLTPGVHTATIVSVQKRKGAGLAAFGLDAFEISP